MGIVLFENKSDCCACGACLNVCSKSAISMKPDAEGFLYPEIDPNKCVECGVCKRVCKYKTSDLNAVESTYAVTNRDEKQIMKAASGGLFSAAASTILSDGGCVFGVTLTFDSGHPDTHHIKRIFGSCKDRSMCRVGLAGHISRQRNACSMGERFSFLVHRAR